MNKKQAISKLVDLEKEVMELRRIIEQPEDKLQAARESLQAWLEANNGKLSVKWTEGYITYYRGARWVLQMEFKDRMLWCYYYEFWDRLGINYGLNHSEIQQVVKETVCKTLNCEGFTPLGAWRIS